MTKKYRLPIDGLNMSESDKLELVNRMNRHFPDKFVLEQDSLWSASSFNQFVWFNPPYDLAALT